MNGLRFLRPYLCEDLLVSRMPAYARFFNSSRPAHGGKRTRVGKLLEAKKNATGLSDRHDIQERLRKLEGTKALIYPRMERSKVVMTCREFNEHYSSSGLSRPRSPADNTAQQVTIQGRVMSVRVAGKGLFFIDVVQDSHATQILCNFTNMVAIGSHQFTSEDFQKFCNVIRRGDIIAVRGVPYLKEMWPASVIAKTLPIILSPSLASLPTTLEDRETRIRNRHADFLVNKSAADTIRLRSHIIKYMRDFLTKDNFLEVQTPIIADKAGGAIARPFTTVATEFSDKPLTLRIAPEIWLKRMILGGFDRVFEIGPAFRNEGLDATHNPEFTTCEFYKAYAELEELVGMTEQLVSSLAEHVKGWRKSTLRSLPEVDESLFTTPYKRIEFIPTIEAALGESLPDLASEDVEAQLLALFASRDLQPPASPTLPRLLDKLSSIYIEPHCVSPTFITHHPACMAPLAKSFFDPTSKQIVSARAELFIHHKEIANMYEEENSPFEQRAKFVQQAKWRDGENRTVIDESYLEALEYGLPPTGGWGGGVDRLVMLLSGARRISDVLPFGSLRNVVNLGKEGPVEMRAEGKEEVL